ncbi:hypothetical protein [Priestia filamentosa]|uniref:hypothetical protein n=1 Tax=Priestia filamentosa TaxID=1402861 RepID=UPI0028946B1F|nr:hypothetical protein [Priestia filamentosa]MDT3766393.1 hypothetical protein [Priestia filamentosa]
MIKDYDYVNVTYFNNSESTFADFFRYRVRSPLINACIEGGKINGVEIRSYTGYNYQYTMYLLTSLVKFAFGIQRRLGYEETYYIPVYKSEHVNARKDFEEILSLAHSILDEMFNEAVQELQTIWKHTQYMLKRCNLIKDDGTVNVYRSLNEIEIAQILDPLHQGTLNNPNHEFTIQTNVLISGERNHDNLERSYAHKSIKVCLQVPARHILMHPDFILTSYARKNQLASSLDYENEVLFFNPDMKGLLTFTSSQIHMQNDKQLNNLIQEVKGNKDNYEKWKHERYIPYWQHINEESYKLMMDVKFLFFNDQLSNILESLKPRVRKKVIKELNR